MGSLATPTHGDVMSAACAQCRGRRGCKLLTELAPPASGCVRVQRGARALRLLLGDALGDDRELLDMAWAVLRVADDPAAMDEAIRRAGGPERIGS